jgi:hypothetical protein
MDTKLDSPIDLSTITVEIVPIIPIEVGPILTESDTNTNTNTNSLLVLLIENSNKNIGSPMVQLSDSDLNILKELISVSPSSFNDINDCILLIIKDGKIDVKDIPPLIKIIKDIYILSHQQINITIKMKDLITSIGSIIKYVLQIVLYKNNISSPELIVSCDNLIDMAVEMIQLQSSLKSYSKSKICSFKLC